MHTVKLRARTNEEETCLCLLIFFRLPFSLMYSSNTRKERETNWQNTFPADDLCAYSTVYLPVSFSSLRIATGVSLSTAVGDSSYCT